MSPIVGNTSSEGKKPDAPTIYSATATGSDVSLDIQPGSWNGKGYYTFTIVDTNGTYYPGMTYMGTPITLSGFMAGTSLQFYAYTVTDYGVDSNISNYSDPVAFQELTANYVASGYDGSLYYSTNLINWNQATGVSAFNSGFYINSTFYVSDGMGYGSYSTDGMNWTSNYGDQFNYGTRISYANGQFVSRGNGTSIWVSTDFINWTSRVGAVSYTYFDATNKYPFRFNGRWWTNAPGTKVLEFSTDTVTWSSTTVNAPKMPFSSYWSLHYFGSHFYGLAAGFDNNAGTLVRSTDGNIWTTVTLPSGYPSGGFSDVSLSSGNGRLFINGGSFGGMITSTDGTTWTTPTLPSNFSPVSTRVASRPSGRWAFLNNDYSGPVNVLSSTNGTSFSLGLDLTTLLPTRNDAYGNPLNWSFGDMIYGNRFVVSAFAQDYSNWPPTSYTIFRNSTDAVTWSGWSSQTSRNGNQFGSRIWFANGVFATSTTDYMNDSQNILISSNATSWTKVVGPQNVNLGWITGVANNLFIWSGIDSIIHTSSNGSTWTQRSTQISGYWATWAFGNSRYVSQDFFDTPVVVVSTNLTTWSSTTYSGPMLPESINYNAAGNGTIGVIVPHNPSFGGYAQRSTDGITWTSSDLYINPWTQVTNVAHGNGVFVVGVDYSGIFVSTNGTTWSQYSFPDSANKPDNIDFSGSQFYATGANYGSTIYSSTDGISWTANSTTLPGYSWANFPQVRVIGKI